jgi:hypothetical protein
MIFDEGILLHGAELMPAARSWSAAMPAKMALVSVVPACALAHVTEALLWALAMPEIRE